MSKHSKCSFFSLKVTPPYSTGALDNGTHSALKVFKYLKNKTLHNIIGDMLLQENAEQGNMTSPFSSRYIGGRQMSRHTISSTHSKIIHDANNLCTVRANATATATGLYIPIIGGHRYKGTFSNKRTKIVAL